MAHRLCQGRVLRWHQAEGLACKGTLNSFSNAHGLGNLSRRAMNGKSGAKTTLGISCAHFSSSTPNTISEGNENTRKGQVRRAADANSPPMNCLRRIATYLNPLWPVRSVDDHHLDAQVAA